MKWVEYLKSLFHGTYVCQKYPTISQSFRLKFLLLGQLLFAFITTDHKTSCISTKKTCADLLPNPLMDAFHSLLPAFLHLSGARRFDYFIPQKSALRTIFGRLLDLSIDSRGELDRQLCQSWFILPQCSFELCVGSALYISTCKSSYPSSPRLVSFSSFIHTTQNCDSSLLMEKPFSLGSLLIWGHFSRIYLLNSG